MVEPQPGSIRYHIRHHGFRIVTPSAPLARYWWRRISLELWDGTVPQPKAVKVKHDRKAWAWTHTDGERPGEIDLDIDAYPLTKKRFVEVLVHESVHAYLWIAHGDNKTVHGPAFMQHKHKIKRVLGLTLGEKVSV
jgi:hypothetical protein